MSSGNSTVSHIGRRHRSSLDPSFNGVTRFGQLLLAGNSEARSHTNFSLTQSGPPEHFLHITFTLDSPTHSLTSFGLPILVPPHPCSSPNFQGEFLLNFVSPHPRTTAITFPILHTLSHFPQELSLL